MRRKNSPSSRCIRLLSLRCTPGTLLAPLPVTQLLDDIEGGAALPWLRRSSLAGGRNGLLDGQNGWDSFALLPGKALPLLTLPNHTFPDFLHRLEHRELEIGRGWQTETGGTGMTPTLEELGCKLVGIDRRRGTQAGFDTALLHLNENDMRIRIGNRRNEFIENARYLFAVRPHLGQVRQAHCGPGDLGRVIHLNAVQGTSPDLQGREGLGLVNVLDDLLLARSEIEELCSHFERAGRRVGVLKTPGVGDETREEECREIRRHFLAPFWHVQEPVVEHLGDAGRCRVDELELAVARIADVMIDIEHGDLGEEIYMVDVERPQERQIGR